MRKRIISEGEREDVSAMQNWLDVARLCEVEVTSEDATHPIDAALLPNQGSGWQAAGPGKQTIRFLFDQPQHLHRIWMNFVETKAERTQEYLLRWSADRGQSFQDIVRQQWNFSPPATTSETEDYRVDLPAVTVLELTITPNIGGGNTHASLAHLRLG
jgi:hypothetical protein